MGKPGKIALLLPLALAASIGLLALLRPRSSTPVDSARRSASTSAPSAPPALAPPPPRLSPAQAADAAQIAALLQRLRDAALRGDALTREAMIQGLVKRGPSARPALQDALGRERDARALDAYAEAIGRLP